MSIPRVSADVLKQFLQLLFEATGLAADDAQLCAHTIVLQEMRGVSTHGLRGLAPNLEGLQSGRMNPRPERRVLRDFSAVTILDGDHGVGMIGCMAAMGKAIEKAKAFGIGFSIVINNNHFQSAAPYCLRAVENEMIGIAFSNTQASMGYPGAVGRVIGNSPLGFAAPTASNFPLVFDSALSISGGKLGQLIQDGRRILPALIGLDSEGNQTDDPGKVLRGGTPLPIGGHKGAGLGVLIEVLTGVLGGGAFLSQIIPPEQRASKENAESQTCITINIEFFMSISEFRERISIFIEDLKNNPLAPGYEEILLPGERAGRAYQESQEQGVLLNDEIQDILKYWSHQLDVPYPM